ncbi:MAG: sulfate adenylyltransferase subunit CysD [Vicinamibacterales bacterium]
MRTFLVDELGTLEAESLHILRETAAEFERPVLLYSVGKDSSVLLHLALKAFAPGRVPFPFLHVDTGFKFQAMYTFRDQRAREAGIDLRVWRNEPAIAAAANPFALGTERCCGLLKTEALLGGLEQLRADAAIGGARREEERSRAKERVFSVRSAAGQWDPRRQRPELWQLYNPRLGPGESMRVFPLSNWTELDVWRYIERERIPVNPLYFAEEREVVERGGQLLVLDGPFAGGGRYAPSPGTTVSRVTCRFRSLGCVPCSGAVRSSASTVAEIIDELRATRISERSTRVIDHDSDASMEKKKREGYF